MDRQPSKRNSVPAHGNSASPIAFCKFRSFPIGVCLNSCAAASRCAASSRTFRSGFHSPIIPFEVLLSGTCLVASTELIAKLPAHGRLPHGYGCVAIEDVNDIDALSSRLAAIVEDPKPVTAMGARGRKFACDLQRDADFPLTLERILEVAVTRQRISSTTNDTTVGLSFEAEAACVFPLTRFAEVAIGNSAKSLGLDETPAERVIDLARAREVLAALKRGINGGQTSLRPFAQGVEIEIAIADAERKADALIARKVPIRCFVCVSGSGRWLKVTSPNWCPYMTFDYVCSSSTSMSPTSWTCGISQKFLPVRGKVAAISSRLSASAASVVVRSLSMD